MAALAKSLGIDEAEAVVAAIQGFSDETHINFKGVKVHLFSTA